MGSPLLTSGSASVGGAQQGRDPGNSMVETNKAAPEYLKLLLMFSSTSEWAHHLNPTETFSATFKCGTCALSTLCNKSGQLISYECHPREII